MDDIYTEPWKTILLVAIVVKFVYRLVGLLHEHSVLNISEAKLKVKYEALPQDVTDLIEMKQLIEARNYNKGVNKISIAWEVMRCIFEFSVILLDFLAFVWYGWLDVLQRNGHCGQSDSDSPDTYGIYM